MPSKHHLTAEFETLIGEKKKNENHTMTLRRGFGKKRQITRKEKKKDKPRYAQSVVRKTSTKKRELQCRVVRRASRGPRSDRTPGTESILYKNTKVGSCQLAFGGSRGIEISLRETLGWLLAFYGDFFCLKCFSSARSRLLRA